MRERGGRAPLLVLGGALVFLWVPVLVLVGMSFNAAGTPYTWGGATLDWYAALARNEEVLTGLGNTLLVAAGATVGSVILGTPLAIGLHRHLRSGAWEALSLGPAIAPDLVLAIGLLSLFVLSGVTLGLHSVLLGHLVFGTAFVAAIVRTRLGHTDPALEEASRDLGATPLSTFFRITIPSLAPAILAGGLLVFTLSLDEFVIAFFTNGPATPTLPIVIYSMVRFGLTPEINALAAVLLLVTFTVVLAAQRLTGIGGRRRA